VQPITCSSPAHFTLRATIALLLLDRIT